MNIIRHPFFRPFLAVAAACVLLAGCVTGPAVRTDYDPGANFGQYKTWGWYSPIAMEQAGYSSWVSERIKANVQREMEARGYRYQAKSPDLKVNFQAVAQERSDVYSVPRTDIAWLYSYRARSYVAVPVWYDETMVSRYTQGTLTVDLVDAAKNRMVWTGDAIARVVRRSPEQRAANIDTAIGAIFAKYPYRAGDSQPAPLPKR
ncbi:DUF4136 domain-containing protein [Lysobacter pythonis]|uniref:DUF4136 domain-containing protein n=1 Tax=Solilutibacter pythonis TaxID=2483112 RepID=A0A3M2HXW6_9GAMM|nr:DUF4136 domain-containing protein [Lysobacter pythonis]RMH93095.1 DUF4136 domain-containing protein [Lysobacter pythonis]